MGGFILREGNEKCVLAVELFYRFLRMRIMTIKEEDIQDRSKPGDGLVIIRNGSMYFLWWNKPFDVQSTITVYESLEPTSNPVIKKLTKFQR